MSRSDKMFGLRMYDDLKSAVVEADKLNKRSINSEIVLILETHYGIQRESTKGSSSACCETCKFCSVTLCRRYPPAPSHPTVYISNWCGEWRLKEKEDEDM